MNAHLEIMFPVGMPLVLLERDGFLTTNRTFLEFFNGNHLAVPVVVESVAQLVGLG